MYKHMQRLINAKQWQVFDTLCRHLRKTHIFFVYIMTDWKFSTAKNDQIENTTDSSYFCLDFGKFYSGPIRVILVFLVSHTFSPQNGNNQKF